MEFLPSDPVSLDEEASVHVSDAGTYLEGSTTTTAHYSVPEDHRVQYGLTI